MSTSSERAVLEELRTTFPQESGLSWHGIVILAEWALLTLGVVLLLRKMRSVGGLLMLASLVLQGIGGIASIFTMGWINRHEAFWAIHGPWTITTLLFCTGFLLFVVEMKRPNQSPQRNAGSRPSSGDSPASETLSSLGPRG